MKDISLYGWFVGEWEFDWYSTREDGTVDRVKNSFHWESRYSKDMGQTWTYSGELDAIRRK